MTIPDYQALMLPVLRAASKGEVRIGQVVEDISDRLQLSPEDRALLLPSGKQTVISNRIHWAKFYLAKARLIDTPRRGYFKITERGEVALREDPENIDNQYLAKFEEFRDFKEQSGKGNAHGEVLAVLEEQTQTPDEVMRLVHRQVESALAQDLIERIRNAPATFFERLVVTLLLGMGYGGTAADAGRALGRSGDNGVDGVIDQDALGLDRVYIQAKRYGASNSVGAGEIRDFFGSLNLHKATKGLFVTTSTFSPSAEKTAESLSNRIVLVDGDQLARLMIRYNVGCRIEDTLQIKKVDEEFFE